MVPVFGDPSRKKTRSGRRGSRGVEESEWFASRLQADRATHRKDYESVANLISMRSNAFPG
ncbi:hypothetical protein Lsha_2852 [Legionella shakespearei DSM 23087]|uniref:Uncharacterized protein n=1 Tax=Legionella shakespearei DSM 23087 TaxID=1122169 RepID=A0A0W0YHS5_9GAMM|nr:hypothetical protein Lsha_2852 [Legionella shakespearei DSM 23087]